MASEDELLDIALSGLSSAGSKREDVGEHERILRHYPLQMITAIGPCRRILYTTKIDWLTKITDGLEAIPQDVGILWRYSPLGVHHRKIVAGVVEGLGAEFFFVGDLDPLDLATYATLVGNLTDGDERLAGATYLGIANSWVELCQRDLAMADKTLDTACIALDAHEVRSLELLRRQISIDWDNIIGTQALAILESGKKLELEGASSPEFYSNAFSGQLTRLLFG